LEGDFGVDKYLDYSDEVYLHLRLQVILILWFAVQNLVVSAWSNIRSLTYGVICNWVRVDLNHYKSVW
jgi:hypothetical protein